MIRLFLALTVSITAIISTTGFASTSTCSDISDTSIYNGYCIDGLVPGSYPYFDTSVDVTWDKKDDSLTAKYDSKGDSLFYASSIESFAITGTKFDFWAFLDLADEDFGTTTGHIEISGNIDNIDGTSITGKPVLMSADLTGVYRQNGEVIGFNTENIFCHATIDAYVNCTNNEVVYFDTIEAIDFDASKSTKKGIGKTKTTGVALTSVPLPGAVWLFGSGLLGLIGVARRKVRV